MGASIVLNLAFATFKIRPYPARVPITESNNIAEQRTRCQNAQKKKSPLYMKSFEFHIIFQAVIYLNYKC